MFTPKERGDIVVSADCIKGHSDTLAHSRLVSRG
jgi:hypothetical protein